MKKLAIVAIVATTAAVAAPFNGFSVGANLGASFNKYKYNTTAITVPAPGGTPAALSSTFKGTSFIGSLFVGYTKSFNNVIAGLDLGFGFDGSKSFKYNSTAGAEIGSFRVKQGPAFQIAPRLGYKFNDTMAVYGKLGVEWSKMEVQWTENSAPPVTNTPSYTQKRTTTSFTPTLGLEKAFGSVSVRGEVGYKVGNKKSFQQGDQFKRNAVVMTVGASYNF